MLRPVEKDISLKIAVIAIILLVFSVIIPMSFGRSIPEFSAVDLNGQQVSSDILIGQVTLLIITPSQEAEQATREWVDALRRAIDPRRYLIRNVIAVDPPFFITMPTAIEQAKKKVPKRYHGQTWLFDKPVLEKAFNVPRESVEACIVVLDSEGNAVKQIHGALTERRLQLIVAALQDIS